MFPDRFFSTTSRCCLALLMATGANAPSHGDLSSPVVIHWSRHNSPVESRHDLAAGSNPAIGNLFPEGNSAHSRWSSAAIPPDCGLFHSVYPGGIAAFASLNWFERLESLRDSGGSEDRVPVVSLRSTTGYGLRPLRGGELCRHQWVATRGRSCESVADTPHPEKLYDGQTLDAWRERIKSLDLQSSEAAAAVPGLMAIVEDETAPWFTRRQAALTLGRIGAPAAAAIPLMERYAMAPSGDGETSPPLWAIKSLALFGKVAAPATLTLARLLNDPSTDAAVRLMSIEALGRIGNAHPLALSTVVNQLQLHEPFFEPDRVRSGADLDRVAACIESLELFRGDAESSVPVLLRYSEDREERIRRAVAVTLGSIGPRASDAASRLTMMTVADQSEDVRDVAAVALGQIGGTELLTKILNHRDAETRERAATGFGYTAGNDSSASEALARARGDASPTVRIAAIEATHRRSPAPHITAPAAAKELTAPDRHVRLRAMRFLTKLGPQASSAIPELEQLRSHPEQQVRRSAEKLLETVRN